jgi:hypothetical protein
MFIMFEGRIKNRAVVEQYVDNLCKALNIHRLGRALTITFQSVLDNQAQGLCEGDKDSVDISIARKGQTFLVQMQALAHEMVHARQFLRGQLSSDGVWKWKGRSADNYSYMNQPWEKEAYRLERELFLDCFPFDEEI